MSSRPMAPNSPAFVIATHGCVLTARPCERRSATTRHRAIVQSSALNRTEFMPSVTLSASFGRSLRLTTSPHVYNDAGLSFRKNVVHCSVAANPPTSSSSSSSDTTSTAPIHAKPLLLRALLGEDVERPPVWLMRQAGRYMAEFRKYSDKIAFRERSETPEIAFELSMQPYRAFQTDGIIMFSDILTPLPAVGVEFDIQPGTGPVISNRIASSEQAKAVLEAATSSFNPVSQLPFVSELLGKLKTEISQMDRANPPTLLGFVGAPFTLAAYAIEGRAPKVVRNVKGMMYSSSETERSILKNMLSACAELAGKYAVHQLNCGAQAVQVFDSWAHHLTPEQYREYALPAAKRTCEIIKESYPEAPVIFFANGCGGKLEHIRDALFTESDSGNESTGRCIDALQIDWTVDMADARRILGDEIVLQGNVDPGILLAGSEVAIREQVRSTTRKAGSRRFVLNLGHGVIKETPENSVAVFCDEARKCMY